MLLVVVKFLVCVGEFGSERLVQRVVDTLLRLTRTAELVDSTQLTEVDGEASLTSAPSWWQSDQAHKILLHGNVSTVCICYSCQL